MKADNYGTGTSLRPGVSRSECGTAQPAPEQLQPSAFRELMDCVGDSVILFDAELRVTEANREAAVAFGYSRGEFIAKHLSALIVPEERRSFIEFAAGLTERRGGQGVFIAKSNRKFLIRYSLSPLRDSRGDPSGYLFVGRFAGERDASRIAAASNGLAERIFKGFSDPVFIVDGASRTVVDCNDIAVAVFGFAREDVLGRRLLRDAASEDERARNEVLMARASEAYAVSGIFRERLRIQKKDGPAIPCDFIGLPFFKPEGSLSFIVAMLFDRTSEEDREAALEALVARASALAADLSAAAARPHPAAPTRLSALGFTQRQIEIARLLALGSPSKEIAYHLGIADSTVRNHLAVMFRKLGVSSRMGFVRVLTERRIRIA